MGDRGVGEVNFVRFGLREVERERIQNWPLKGVLEHDV